MILVTYTHQISALGDNSTTRYGVNNIFQRDVRTHGRTHVRTYEHSPVSRKCSFGAISGPALCAAVGSKVRTCLDLSIAPPVLCNATPAVSRAPPVLINALTVLSTAPQVLCNATAVLCSATPVRLVHRHSSAM